MADVLFGCAPGTDVNYAVGEHFDDAVHHVVVHSSECIQVGGEEPVHCRAVGARHQDDQAAMQVVLHIELEEIPAIVGDDDVVVLDCKGNQVVVLPAALADMRAEFGDDAPVLGDGHQTRMQALVNQQLEAHGPRFGRDEVVLQLGPSVASAQAMTASMPSTGKVGKSSKICLELYPARI